MQVWHRPNGTTKMLRYIVSSVLRLQKEAMASHPDTRKPWVWAVSGSDVELMPDQC